MVVLTRQHPQTQSIRYPPVDNVDEGIPLRLVRIFNDQIVESGFP